MSQVVLSELFFKDFKVFVPVCVLVKGLLSDLILQLFLKIV